MSRFIIIFLFIIVSVSLKANDNIDSLLNIAKNTSSEIEQSKIYFRIAEEFVNEDLNSSVFYLSKAMQNLKECDSLNKAKMYMLDAYIHLRKSDFNIAIELANKSISYLDTTNSQICFRAKYIIVNTYIAQFYFDKAFQVLTLLEENSHKTNYDRIKIASLFADIFSKERDFEAAQQKLLDALPFIDSINSTNMKSKFFLNMALTFKRKEEVNSAKKYFKEAYKTATDSDNKYLSIVIGVNLAEMLFKHQQYEEAIPYYREAMLFHKKEGNWIDHYILLSRMSLIYSNINQLDSARLFLNRIKNKPDSIGNSELNMYYYNALSAYYKETRQYKKALHYKDLNTILYDSIQESENREILNKLRVQYETEKKGKEIIVLKKENEKNEIRKQKIYYSWLATSLLLIILIIIFVFYRKNIISQKKLMKRKNQLRKHEKIRIEQEKKLVEIEKEKIEQERFILLQKNKLLESQQEVANQKLQAHKIILTSTNNSLLQHSQLTSILIDTLKGLKPYSNKEGQNKINSSLANLSDFSKEKNWQTFEQNFILLYPNFLNKLKQIYPSLTIAERKQCSFIKMDLSSSEISKITLQEKHSIYRLNKKIRDKIGVETNEELILVLKQIG